MSSRWTGGCELARPQRSLRAETHPVVLVDDAREIHDERRGAEGVCAVETFVRRRWALGGRLSSSWEPGEDARAQGGEGGDASRSRGEPSSQTRGVGALAF